MNVCTPLSNPRLATSVALTLAGLLLGAAPAAAAAGFQVRLVGDVVGADINEAGTVVGPGFKWTNGALTRWGRDGFAVNDLGDVVGGVARGETRSAAFLWSPQLDSPTGDRTAWTSGDAVATDVNNSRVVIGALYREDERRSRAFVWRGETVEVLETFGGTFGVANAINRDGIVVGAADDKNGVGRAFRWSHKAGVRPLALGEHFQSAAMDIDDDGRIVGWVQQLAGGPTRAFATTPGGDLALLPGEPDHDDVAMAAGGGLVVGVRSGPGGDRAVAWDTRKGAPVELHGAIGGEFRESRAVAINGSRQIVITALRQHGSQHSSGWVTFVLSPL